MFIPSTTTNATCWHHLLTTLMMSHASDSTVVLESEIYSQTLCNNYMIGDYLPLTQRLIIFMGQNLVSDSITLCE